MSKVKLSRREREKIRHKEEILSAALKLFSSKGFHNVSIQDIANESEFGVGTLYNFFKSKEQLFSELLRSSVDKFGQLLIPILDSKKGEKEKLSEFIQAHVNLVESNIDFIRLYISQYGTNASVDLVLEHESMDLKKTVSEKLEDIIKTGIQKKVFRRVHPEIAALSLQATLQAFGLDTSKDFDIAKVRKGFSKIESFFMNSLIIEEKNNDTKRI